MQEPVERSRGHDDVPGEDLAPVGEGFVAGQDDGLTFFIAFADGLEEQAGMRLFQRKIADFINDEQFGPSKVLDLAGEAVLGDGDGHATGQIDGGSEVDAVTHVSGQHAERDSQMGFTYAGRTEEDYVAAFVQEASCCQFVEDAPVERRLFLELEVSQMFLIGQFGELQVQEDRLFVTEARLSVAFAPSKTVAGFGRSAAIVSTSCWLSGSGTSSRLSGPETARRMLARIVVAGGFDVHAATPTYGRSFRVA